MKKRLGRARPIVWGVLAVLAGVLALAGFLSLRSPAWLQDFLANFLADLAVAGFAFLVVDLVFGLVKRREQEDRARKQAQVFLGLEIEQNRTLIENTLTTWHKGEPKSIDLEEQGWIDLKKSALFSMLPQELVKILRATYIALEMLPLMLDLWQQTEPDWKTLRRDGTEVKPRDELRQATIHLAEAALHSLDAAHYELHE